MYSYVNWPIERVKQMPFQMHKVPIVCELRYPILSDRLHTNTNFFIQKVNH